MAATQSSTANVRIISSLTFVDRWKGAKRDDRASALPDDSSQGSMETLEVCGEAVIVDSPELFSKECPGVVMQILTNTPRASVAMEPRRF